MKIAFVSTILNYPWGGADVLWTRTAEAALNRGDQLLVAVSPAVASHPRIAALQARGAVLHRRTGFTQYRGRISRWRLALGHGLRRPGSLTAALARFKPDLVVLCQGGVFDFLVEEGLNRWLTRRHCPYALICQSNDPRDRFPPASQAIAREFFSRAFGTFFVSSQNLEVTTSQIGVPVPRASVIANPIEIAASSDPSWPSETSPRLAVVSRLEMEAKGHDVLIDALAEVAATHDFHVDCYGRGPDEPALRARLTAHQLENRVSFRGYESDVRKIWAHHHWLILPSRREGCALAMLEALACGRPVLAAEVGGVSDWIEPGVNGLTCKPGDSASLADAINRLFACMPRWPAMGAEAGHRARLGLATPAEQTLLSAFTPTAPRFKAGV